MTAKHAVSRALTVVTLLAAMAISLPLGAETVAARPKTCTYKGYRYSQGASFRSQSNEWRICDDGDWIIFTDA